MTRLPFTGRLIQAVCRAGYSAALTLLREACSRGRGGKRRRRESTAAMYGYATSTHRCQGPLSEPNPCSVSLSDDRACCLQAGGYGFESRRLHHISAGQRPYRTDSADLDPAKYSSWYRRGAVLLLARGRGCDAQRCSTRLDEVPVRVRGPAPLLAKQGVRGRVPSTPPRSGTPCACSTGGFVLDTGARMAAVTPDGRRGSCFAAVRSRRCGRWR